MNTFVRLVHVLTRLSFSIFCWTKVRAHLTQDKKYNSQLLKLLTKPCSRNPVPLWMWWSGSGGFLPSLGCVTGSRIEITLTGLCFPFLHLSTGEVETLWSQALSEIMRLLTDKHKHRSLQGNAACFLSPYIFTIYVLSSLRASFLKKRRNSLTFWEICLYAFLVRVGWESVC